MPATQEYFHCDVMFDIAQVPGKAIMWAHWRPDRIEYSVRPLPMDFSDLRWPQIFDTFEEATEAWNKLVGDAA